MCRYCRHSDLHDVKEELKRKFPVPVTGEEKKYLLTQIENEIRRLKKSKEGPAYLVSYKLDALRFAAFVLNQNRLQNKGWKEGGWMNELRDGPHLFVA